MVIIIYSYLNPSKTTNNRHSFIPPFLYYTGQEKEIYMLKYISYTPLIQHLQIFYYNPCESNGEYPENPMNFVKEITIDICILPQFTLLRKTFCRE